MIKIKPKDADAKKKLDACEKAIKEDAFLKAIESESTIPLSQQINIADIVVEDTYTGPRLPDDGAVSIEFVQEMMETFRGQKLIHRKYLLQVLLGAKRHYESLSTLLRISLPILEGEGDGPKKRGHINVCGDTHGQFFDLCNIFEVSSYVYPYLHFLDRWLSFSHESVSFQW